MFSVAFFSTLRARASAEIAVLKTDIRSAETRIEDAFHLGVVSSTLQAIEADVTKTVTQKLQEAYALGKAYLQSATAPVLTTAAPAAAPAPSLTPSPVVAAAMAAVAAAAAPAAAAAAPSSTTT